LTSYPEDGIHGGMRLLHPTTKRNTITVPTLNIGPYLVLTELSGNFRKLTFFFNSGFIEVKIDQRSEIGNIPCNLMQGKFDRHKILFLMHAKFDQLISN